ncbi:MarR family winged helix-turn-helix transcriptional regulator [Fructobacillus parabroussonetiae]|uniref:MarR family transcriptional regulator n=1 Tax=Fructobacillus parabroussonetiae TaxID=2713174 RepID=A0ABS5QXY7_9LACO|nr:MarR family transcriptional regulator [Fructobacillus parabroussonetiae]MBS9337231.1 MarR family transcriptional regulator [Fructobacillus parabroussonetiae]
MIEFEIFRQMGAISRTATTSMNQAAKKYQLENNLFLYLIRIVENEGLTQSSLAELVRVDKTTLSRALRKLDERGYIDKVAGPGNRKAKQLFPTEKGRESYQFLEKIEKEYIHEKMTKLTTTEQKELRRLLAKVDDECL